MCITDAIQDCKNEALKGATPDFAGIAADYEISAALLERKWTESFPNGYVAIESAPAPRQTVKPTAYRVPAASLQAEVDRMCTKYRVSAERCTIETIRGVPYTIIGRFRTRLLGVSHIDGSAYKISA